MNKPEHQLPTFTGLGGTHEVGASCYLYDFGHERILVDAGARPNQKGAQAMPELHYLKQFPPTIGILTHAHLDHVGFLPLVLRHFPELKFYCTQPTRMLAEHVMRDSLNIGRQSNINVFKEEEMIRALHALRPMPLGSRAHIREGVFITLQEAGHLPGAAQVMIEVGPWRIFHTGDINTVATAITPPAWTPPKGMQVDVLTMEATYGDTLLPNRKKQVKDLIAQVSRITQAPRYGRILIPSFALGRAQEIAALLANAINNGTLEPVNIYLDGLTRTVTQTLETHPSLLPEAYQKRAKHEMRSDVLRMAQVEYIRDHQHRQQILQSHDPCIVIASSGMLHAGASPIYACEWLPDPNNALMVVGYQDAESPGKKLLNLKKGQVLHLPAGKGERKSVTVNAEITRYHLSAHADRSALIRHAKHINARMTILMHGEEKARLSLAKGLEGYNPILAHNMQVISLAAEQKKPPQEQGSEGVSVEPVT